jgi:hypothetical protein
VTIQEKEWLSDKYKDMEKWLAIFWEKGEPDIQNWDSYRFLKIINDLRREIRRLKTEALKK